MRTAQIVTGVIRKASSKFRILLEKPGGSGAAGAPDIDERVYVRGEARTREAVPPIGEFARVKIIGHTDYDLIAELL